MTATTALPRRHRLKAFDRAVGRQCPYGSPAATASAAGMAERNTRHKLPAFKNRTTQSGAI
eukprot:scaffold11876_cov228-Skeletonema_marinoi.AAC.1